uniref:Protein CHUP1, chloroplastic n=1 Tax=Aegilops tauschii TaxID=37682 RepID=M8CAF1_AEGTA
MAPPREERHQSAAVIRSSDLGFPPEGEIYNEFVSKMVVAPMVSKDPNFVDQQRALYEPVHSTRVSYNTITIETGAEVQPARAPPEVAGLLRAIEQLQERESRLRVELLEQKILRETVAIVPFLEAELAAKSSEVERYKESAARLESENMRLCAELDAAALELFVILVHVDFTDGFRLVVRPGGHSKTPGARAAEAAADTSATATATAASADAGTQPEDQLRLNGSVRKRRRATSSAPPPPPAPATAASADAGTQPEDQLRLNGSVRKRRRATSSAPAPAVHADMFAGEIGESKRDGGSGADAASGGGAAATRDMIGEIENRSAHLLAIRSDVETQGDFIRLLIKEVEGAAFVNIEAVVSFVKWLDNELSRLVDERAVLKHFEWPEQKADALREAAFGYCDLKKLEGEASSFRADPRQPCAAALKKMQALFEKLEHGVYNLARVRDGATSRYGRFQIPSEWMQDAGIVSQIKFQSVKLARKYLERVSSELEAIKVGPDEEELMLQAVRFAFRVHQFASGFDADTMRAFQELKEKASLCRFQRQKQSRHMRQQRLVGT